jgi:competence protein ComEA
MKALVNWLLVMVCLVVFRPCVSVAAPAAESAKAVSVASVVAVNSATVEQLQTLPGVGEVTARRIVEFRQAHGPFTVKDDLLKVKGIGVQTLNRIRGNISLD